MRSRTIEAIPNKPSNEVATTTMFNAPIGGRDSSGRDRNQARQHQAPARSPAMNNDTPTATSTITAIEGCCGKAIGPTATPIRIAHQTTTMRAGGDDKL